MNGSPSSSDYTPQLQKLMRRAGFSSIRELSRYSGVEERQFFRLCQGLVMQTRVDVLMKIAEGLGISLMELLRIFAPDDSSLASEGFNSAFRQEYERLQAEMEQLRESVGREFEQASLDILESWLLNWPKVTEKVEENPQIPAKNILPLVKPVERLVQQWGVEIIAPIASEVPYNPHLHQLVEGTAQPGDRVTVTSAGYRKGDRLLCRAEVKVPTDDHLRTQES